MRKTGKTRREGSARALTHTHINTHTHAEVTVTSNWRPADSLAPLCLSLTSLALSAHLLHAAAAAAAAAHPFNH